MRERDSYANEMAPSQYIEKVSLATGEVLDETIEPHQLLVHSHRDYHIVDVQARWLMSRLVGAVGDEDLVVHAMKGVRKAALKTSNLIGKVLGKSTSEELSKRLLGLKEREYYFRYKRHPLEPAEITRRLRKLQRDAEDKLAEVAGDGDELGLRVLLTGGTGFVGKEVIWQAARDPDIAELVVLVRPKTIRDRKTGEVIRHLTPADRGAELLDQLWLEGDHAAKVRFVAGDIEEPNLGIDDAEVAALQDSITHVIHCAASVAFDDPYDASFRANVHGSQNALGFSKRLQDAAGPFVAHISIETSYIHGRQTRQPAREEEVVFPRNFYNNYYELTKALGSIETERYMLEEGLRVTQLCPSIVIGQADTGNNRGDTKVVNAPVNLFGRVKDAESVEGGLRERSKARLLANMAATFPADPSAELNIIPVDWVARGMIASLKAPQAVGERVHLATDNRLTSQEITDIVGEELEVEVRLAEPTMHRNVTLPALTKALEKSGQDRIAFALQKLGDIFGSYSEWGQPIHVVGNDQKLLGMPAARPNTNAAFRLLCRHNRWVQDYGRVRDLNEVSRREKLWTELLVELEEDFGKPVHEIAPDDFREALHQRVDVDTFVRRTGNSSKAVVPARRTQLPGADTAWLQMDRPDNRMIINAMVLFDDELDIDELRSTVSQRLLSFDRFRQRVSPAEGLETLPYWEDDPLFDLDNHLFTHDLEGGDDRALNDLVDRLVSEGLPDERPPWQLHVVTGWDGGSALIARLHHCIGDGAALVYVMLSLTDAIDLDAEDASPERRKRGTFRNLVRLVNRSKVALHDHIAPLADPRKSLELAGAGMSGAAALGKLMLMPADPPSTLRGRLDVRKKTAWSQPISLAEVKSVKDALGATVNDVLMAALAGALRRYLAARGDDPGVLKKLRAVVPVNLRPPDETPELGNRFGLVFLDLPIGLEHELDRLDDIQSTMNGLKASPDALISLKALQGMGHLSEALEDRALRMFTSKASVVASNVPGPYEPLKLAGKPVKSCMFWVPQSGDIGVGLSILSYAGEIRVGVMADANLMDNPQELVSAFEEEVAALSAGLG